MIKEEILEWIDKKERFLIDIAEKIWRNPEISMQEEMASKLQSSILEKEGFKVKYKIAGMPTAFIAEYGSCKPVLGILGEYDALPGLSQQVVGKQKPIKKGGAGHGCGHNLLGTAGLGAVLAIKNLMEHGDISGTVRYYGCPAEETLVGKVFMAREKVFDDLDACLTWHPKNVNAVSCATTLAMNSIHFKFKGVASHAATTPYMGRSALDAVELMNVGANYLREHVTDAVRIHYSIIDGGCEPNIVPSIAESWYYIRAPKLEEVKEVLIRLEKIAKGAAMMTETEVEWEFQTGCYQTHPNEILGNIIYRNMKEIGGPSYSEKDKSFAKEIEKSYLPNQKHYILITCNAPEELYNIILHEGVAETFDRGIVSSGSSDIGDVSHIVPLAQFFAAAWPIGTSSHSWQATASSGSGIGYSAMIFAAKTLACSLFDLYKNDGNILEDAGKEFINSQYGSKYISPLPEMKLPRFNGY